jgi:hypothetical protein
MVALGGTRVDPVFPWLDGGAFVLEVDANPPTAGNWYTLNKWIGGHPTATGPTYPGDMEVIPLYEPHRFDTDVGSRVTLDGVLYYGSEVMTHIHELPVVAGVQGREYYPAVKLDDEFVVYDRAMTWSESDIGLNDKIYADVGVGYPYTAYLETMEIDPAEEVTAGDPMHVMEAVFRVHQSGPFKFKRDSQSQQTTEVAVRRDDEYFNPITWLIEKAKIRTATFSRWDSRSSFYVISNTPVALTVQAVRLEVIVGS